MFKLLKWTAIGVVTLVGTGYLVFGTEAGSYLHAATNEIREGIKDQIPIEFQIKRAEACIQEIEPQLDKARREVAQAEVDLERLEGDVSRLEGDVERGERKLRHVSAALSGDGASYQLAGFQRNRVEFDLERTFEAHKNNVALLKGKRALIDRQQRAVEAHRAHLDGIRTEKARLEDMVVALKTQKRQLDALAATSRTIDLDDTPLSRARALLEEVENQLNVSQKMIEDEIFIRTESEVAPQRDIANEVQAWLEGGEQDVEVETIEIR